jgi:hypothetical protein
VVELVDTQVSEACAAMHASSSLASGTILNGRRLLMAAQDGIEEAHRVLQKFLNAISYESVSDALAQQGAQKPDALLEMVRMWSALNSEMRSSLIELARAAQIATPKPCLLNI